MVETGSADGGFGQAAFSRVEQARAGVSRSKADEVASLVGLTDKEMARILNVSERTLHRIRPDARLDSNASERLLLLEALIRHGLDVFDERAEVLATCSPSRTSPTGARYVAGYGNWLWYGAYRAGAH